MVALGVVIALIGVLPAFSPHGVVAAPSSAVSSHFVTAAQPRAHLQHECDGMLWSSSVWASYTPSYCYGHDEPTMSYVSNVSGSGEDANFQMVLPADSSSYAQGNFYATVWFGGVVYDTASNGGGNQAYLELQFYPAPPAYTGSGSGAQDCLSNGAFYEAFSAGTNEWFACAIVWQLQLIGGYIFEDAAFAGPIDSAGTTAILVMHSNDHVFVNYSGVAQSTKAGWKLGVSDPNVRGSGSVVLQNGGLILSPYYANATANATLGWGASNPGAIAFAYEVGHSLNPNTPCSYPGDGTCDSYFPGRWTQSGQMQLSLPQMGLPGAQSYPNKIAMSSSQGGENEVNASCPGPSTSGKTNCMYPFYQYRGAYGAFTFGTSAATNDTHDYGNVYQFPATTNGYGQWAADYQRAPWGNAKVSVTPANATSTFQGVGPIASLPIGATGKASGQVMEGGYWLNATGTGCTSGSKFAYILTGGLANVSLNLPCGGSALGAYARAKPASGLGPLKVALTGLVSGGTRPYSYAWSFGDGSSPGTSANVTHTYALAGNYSAAFTVTDKNGSQSTSQLLVQVLTPPCGGKTVVSPYGVVETCHLNKTQQVIFTFKVSKAQWLNATSVGVYEVDGVTHGVSPVFALYAGMGATRTAASAKQSQNGPNASFNIVLATRASGKYGGWGTYWAVVNATGGSGGFCFEVMLWDGYVGAGPKCPVGVASPHSGSVGVAPPGGTGHRSPTGGHPSNSRGEARSPSIGAAARVTRPPALRAYP
ncbi:MAG: PKD domain-containing protein [Thermoplasmata archaeon]|nr:PKD domain-containing protein [Thermoplasmata archaeon]